jgi:hypothetical protein
MGVVMGPTFALMLIFIDPAGIVTPIEHGGSPATAVFAGTSF